MTKLEARKAAERVRKGNQIPDDYKLQTIEQQYIELAGDDPTHPEPVRDLLVWSATFNGERNRWIELSVDDATGKVARVMFSR